MKTEAEAPRPGKPTAATGAHLHAIVTDPADSRALFEPAAAMRRAGTKADDGPFRLDAADALRHHPRDILWNAFSKVGVQMVVCDHRGYPVLFNEAFAGMIREALGIDMKPGMKPYKLLPTEQRKFWDDIYKEVLRGVPLVRKFSVTLPDGENRSYEFIITPLFADGKQIGFFEMSRRLGNKNSDFGIIDSMNFLGNSEFDFFIFNLAQDDSEKFRLRARFASSLADRMLGVADTGDFSSWLEQIHPDDRRLMEKALKDPTKSRFPHLLIRYRVEAVGDWRKYRIDYSVERNPESGMIEISGIVIDITPMLDLAQETLQNVRSEKLNLENRQISGAVKTLLKQREEDRREMEENLYFNLKQKLGPFVDQLKNSGLNGRQRQLLDIIQRSIMDACSPFARSMALAEHRFTPAEIRVAALIREGKKTREIADVLGISPRTVDTHRKNLRKKLELNNSSKNLRSHLLTVGRRLGRLEV